MQIEGKFGSQTLLKEGLKVEIGRGRGFDSSDRTVSRRHVSFEQPAYSGRSDEPRACFQVIGKNPIWAYSRKDCEIRVFRRSERGEMACDDLFCVSAKDPFWFTLKRIDFEEDKNETKQYLGLANELADSFQSNGGLSGTEDVELNSIDVSNIDPVKEFGFVVMGHEFDCYPAKMIRNIKKWEWFLEKPGEDTEGDDIGERKGKRGYGRKRRKSHEEEDDDWKGESEKDKELFTKTRKLQTSKYSTRSKHGDKHTNSTRMDRPSSKKEWFDDEDEDDYTLGGFIVSDDVVEEQGGGSEEEEEEEDFDD